MINDPGGVRRNRRKSPTHTHAPAQRRRSVINRSRPSGKVHTVLSIKSGPRLFPSPLCFGLFTRRRSRFVAHPPLTHTTAVCRANYNEPPSVAPPFPTAFNTAHIYLPLLFVRLFFSPAATFAIRHHSLRVPTSSCRTSCSALCTRNIIRFYPSSDQLIN